MASLVLGIGVAAATSSAVTAGTISAALAAVLTTAAAAIGTYIDQAVLLPALFPPEDIEGPRIGELRVQFAEEGSPLTTSFGSGTRNAGSVIWTSDLIEVEQVQEGGGKGGGGGPSVSLFEYYVDLAVLFSDTKGTPIAELEEITASGRPVYRERPIIDQSIADITFTAGLNGVILFGQQRISSSSSLALGDYVPGGQITITGSVSNDGTYDIVTASSDVGAGTSEITVRNASAVAEGPVASVDFYQDVQNFSESLVADVEIYTGSTTQNPSPTIEALEGVGQVPGWRGYAYVVLRRLYLGEFGNVTPQMNFIYDAGTTGTDGAMITSLAARAELPTSFTTDLDVTDATTPIRGYGFQGVTDLLKAIQPIMIVGDLLAQTNQGGLKFFKRKNAQIIDVAAEDLTAHSAGDEPGEVPMEITEVSEIVRPEAVAVKYIDHQARYQSGQQREKSNVRGTPGSDLTINLPLTLESAAPEARSIAKRLLYEGYINNKSIRVSLPMSYEHAQENDILRVDAFGHIWELLIARKDRGENFLIVCECVVEVRSVLDQPGVAEDPRGTSVDFNPPGGVITFNPYDPPWWDHDIGIPDDPYIAVPNQVMTNGGSYGGANIWIKRKDEADTEYKNLGFTSLQAILGQTTSVLPDGRGVGREYGHTVDIELFRGTLSGATTEAEVIAGATAIVIGSEVISFETATLTGSRTYTLSGVMVRGRLGTLANMTGHAIGEAVLVMRGAIGSLYDSIVPISQALLGQTLEVKAARPGQDLTEVVAKEITPTDAGLRPRPPAAVTINQSGSDITHLRWSRISRKLGLILGEFGAPLSEATERYEVAYEVGGVEVGKTIVKNTNQMSITQTELNAQFGILTTDAVTIKVYQVNLDLGSTGRGDASDSVTRTAV